MPLIAVDARNRRAVITAGVRGPAGRDGSAGGQTPVTEHRAGVTLSALQFVYEVDGAVYPLDYHDTTHIDLIAGITTTAAAIGQLVAVQMNGPVTDAGWNWSPGRVWLGPGGVPTQTPPPDGFDVLIGVATSATTIRLNIQDPIDLE